MLIGVLSDTHGRLHPDVRPAFLAAGVELILHAGDVGDPGVLSMLTEVAPVLAVRGNVDDEGEMAQLPEEISITQEGTAIYMTHIGARPAEWLKGLPMPLPRVAICGHSHTPLLEEAGGVLFLNPGSAGTRPRFGGGLSAALLYIGGESPRAEIITLGK